MACRRIYGSCDSGWRCPSGLAWTSSTFQSARPRLRVGVGQVGEGIVFRAERGVPGDAAELDGQAVVLDDDGRDLIRLGAEVEAAEGGVNIGGVIAAVLAGVAGGIVVAANADDRHAGSLQPGQLLADHHPLQVARIDRIEQVAGVEEGGGAVLDGIAHGAPEALAQPAAPRFEPRERHTSHILAEVIVGRSQRAAWSVASSQWSVVSGQLPVAGSQWSVMILGTGLGHPFARGEYSRAARGVQGLTR